MSNVKVLFRLYDQLCKVGSVCQRINEILVHVLSELDQNTKKVYFLKYGVRPDSDRLDRIFLISGSVMIFLIASLFLESASAVLLDYRCYC